MNYKLLLPVVLVIALIFSSFNHVCQNQEPNTKPHVQFDELVHDYGQILQGANGNYSFKFKNTGKEPLIIQNVQATCGCTIPKKPNQPILPGETSEITVTYDTHRLGFFQKNLTVISNADNANVVLTIKGEVKAKPAEVAPVKEDVSGFTPTAK